MSEEEMQNLIYEEVVEHVVRLVEKGLIRAEQVQNLTTMIEKTMNEKTMSAKITEEDVKKADEKVKEEINTESVIEEKNTKDETEEKGNKTVTHYEPMSDEQFYKFYNGMLSVRVGEDGTENNMVELVEGLAEEIARRGITTEQIEHDVEEYRKKAKEKSDKITAVSQLSDKELMKRLNDFRDALKEGNYATFTNPAEIKLLQDEAKKRGLGLEAKIENQKVGEHEEANIHIPNNPVYGQPKKKISITGFVKAGLQRLGIGKEEVEQAEDILARDTNEKNKGVR